MKHLIIFSIIIIGIVFLTLISWYDNINSELASCSSTYLSKSNVGGKFARGIFANRNFDSNEVIEKAPYIEDSTDNFEGLIRDYIFKKNQTNSVVGFGNASLYNHSDEPNATWTITDTHIEIKSIKPIFKNEEILISYGNNYWSTRKDTVKI